MNNQAIPDPVNINPDPDYDPEAAYRAYYNATAPDFFQGQLLKFRSAGIPVRASLLLGNPPQIRVFLSPGFLLTPTSNSSTQLQIVHLTYEASSAGKLGGHVMPTAFSFL